MECWPKHLAHLMVALHLSVSCSNEAHLPHGCGIGGGGRLGSILYLRFMKNRPPSETSFLNVSASSVMMRINDVGLLFALAIIRLQ